MVIVVYCIVISTFLVYSKSEYTTKIGQCVRPSVYPITLHKYIRLSWNFVQRIISSTSRSSSKMRRVRREIVELSKKLSFFIRPSLEGSTGMFSANFFLLKIIHNLHELTQLLTLIPNLILVWVKSLVFKQKTDWRRSQNAQKMHLVRSRTIFSSHQNQSDGRFAFWSTHNTRI